MWAPCPFHHEKTASFHVDDQKGFYYCWVRLHKGTKTATGYSIICWNYFYFSRQVEKTPEIDARESPLRLIAVHTLACMVGHINVLGEYDFSEKVSAKLPTSSHPKKHRSERSRTGEATVVKTAVDQTTSTIPVAVLVPLCRRTHLSGAWIANIANFRSNNCVYPGCQTHINCKRDQIICDAIAIIRPGSH